MEEEPKQLRLIKGAGLDSGKKEKKEKVEKTNKWFIFFILVITVGASLIFFFSGRREGAKPPGKMMEEQNVPLFGEKVYEF